MNYNTLTSAIARDADGVVFDVKSLYARLQTIPDGRKRRGRRYELAVMLVGALLAKLAGEDEPTGIAEWVQLRGAWFAELFQLRRSQMPHAVTYKRVLGQAGLVDHLEQLVADFLRPVSTRAGDYQITFDGKTLRGVESPDLPHGLHLLAAYLPQTGVVLGQMVVGAKTNEIAVAPKLLKMLDLQGKIVTADALHTQRELSEQIIHAGGDYLWLAKGNQARLAQDIAHLFQPETCLPGTSPVITDQRTAHTTEKNRGRVETRSLTVSSALAESATWPHLQQVFKLTRAIQYPDRTQQPPPDIVYGVTSLSAQQASPARLLHIVRQHWGIENGLHYRRDVTLQEDRLHTASPLFAQVMACLNNLVIGLTRRAFSNLARARRTFAAQPDLALRLLCSCPT